MAWLWITRVRRAPASLVWAHWAAMTEVEKVNAARVAAKPRPKADDTQWLLHEVRTVIPPGSRL